MHECRFVGDMLRKVEELVRSSRAEGVAEIRIQVGPLAEMTPEHFRQHFEYAARGTMVEDARLEIVSPNRVDDPLGRDILLESVTLRE